MRVVGGATASWTSFNSLIRTMRERAKKPNFPSRQYEFNEVVYPYAVTNSANLHNWLGIGWEQLVSY